MMLTMVTKLTIVAKKSPRRRRPASKAIHLKSTSDALPLRDTYAHVNIQIGMSLERRGNTMNLLPAIRRWWNKFSYWFYDSSNFV